MADLAIGPGAGDRTPRVSWTVFLRSRPAAATFALLSFGAAGIHFAVSPDHFAEYAPYGVFFAFLAWFQVLWAAGYLARPDAGWARVAVVVNACVVVLWVYSRAIGLPFGPDPGGIEPVGVADTISSGFEALLVVGLVAEGATAADRIRTQPARWAAAAVVVTIVVVSATIAALIALAPVAGMG